MGLQHDIDDSNLAVIGMIKISMNYVYVLFDPCTIHFFISASFVRRNIGVSHVPLEIDTCISIPSGDVNIVDSICRECILSNGDREMIVNLLVLEINDFDLILGMDLLVVYHAAIDIFEKKANFLLRL